MLFDFVNICQHMFLNVGERGGVHGGMVLQDCYFCPTIATTAISVLCYRYFCYFYLIILLLLLFPWYYCYFCYYCYSMNYTVPCFDVRHTLISSSLHIQGMSFTGILK